VRPHKPILLAVKATHLHPKFNPVNLYNDIALIELAESVDLRYNENPQIGTVCLPSSKYEFEIEANNAR
jgi:hypothetical protein